MKYAAAMRLSPLLISVLVAGCAPSLSSPDGGVDAGAGAPPTADAGADAGADGGPGLDGGVADSGVDAGVSDTHQIDPRGCFDATWGSPVTWDIDAGIRAGWDAGGVTACLPLPPLGLTVTVFPTQEGGWLVLNAVSWAQDAGCRLFVDSVFVTSSGSETFTHTLHLSLDPTDAGLLGGGSYSVQGASTCEVPLDAVGTRTGP